MSEENNINDILGVSETPKDSFRIFDKIPGDKNETTALGDNAAEKIIAILAYILLIGGCIGAVISGSIMMGNYRTEGAGVIVLIGGVLSSIISWAFLMVVANISNNIRQIKHELQKKNKA